MLTPEERQRLFQEEKERVLKERGGSAIDHSGTEPMPLFYEAVALVLAVGGRCSTALLMRRFHIGYNSAAGLLEEMECQGIVSRPDPQTRDREILVDKSYAVAHPEIQEYFLRAETEREKLELEAAQKTWEPGTLKTVFGIIGVVLILTGFLILTKQIPIQNPVPYGIGFTLFGVVLDCIVWPRFRTVMGLVLAIIFLKSIFQTYKDGRR